MTTAWLDAVPYARLLGLQVVNDLLLMPFDEKLVGNPSLPALHGGTLCALLETACIVRAYQESQANMPRVITMTTDFLRSAKPTDTFAACDIERAGRRIVNVRARAWQADESRPVAVAYAHLLRG